VKFEGATDIGHSVKCEVLGDSGQIAQCNVMTEILHSVEYDLLRDSGEVVDCEVL